jgi:hypothetical protein
LEDLTMMTRKEAMRQTHQQNVLMDLGFTPDEADALRRISLTLHRWYEHECNGTIQRDGDDRRGEGRPYWYSTFDGRKIGPAPDRERGAIKRLKAIITDRNARAPWAKGKTDTLSFYLQTDPRGAVLYILRPGDVPPGANVQAYYNRGICVY